MDNINDVLFGTCTWEPDQKKAEALIIEGERLFKAGKRRLAATKLYSAYLLAIGHVGTERRAYNAWAKVVGGHGGDGDYIQPKINVWNQYPRWKRGFNFGKMSR